MNTFSPKLQGNTMEIKFGKHLTNCLVDTGAQISAISKRFLDVVAPDIGISPSRIQRIVGVCGEVHHALGEVNLTFQCQDLNFQQTFVVFQYLHSSVIVGLDFLRANKVVINFSGLEIPVTTGNSSSTIKVLQVPIIPAQPDKTVLIHPLKEVIVPPHEEMLIPVTIPECPELSTVLLEPSLNLVQLNLAGTRTITTVIDNKGYYRLLNPTSLPVFLKKTTIIAKAEIVNDKQCFPFDESAETSTIFNIGCNPKHKTPNYEQIVKDLGINLDNLALTKEQKTKLYSLLGRNRHVFAKDLSEIGETNLHTHTIHIKPGSVPVSSAPYRLNPERREDLDNHLIELQESGLISESDSPWHSPVVMVKKPNGQWRICVDYRKLNKITEPMSFPIPHMSDVFDTLAASKAEIFSTLDLRSGFWQVPLDEESRKKAAFITHQGVFTFNRLSMGMMNAPMTFQALMTKCLKNLNYKIALVYIDDVIVISKTFDEHLHHLEQIFSNLTAANLKLHPEKCQFATNEVKYLGHIISKHGIKVNEDNIKKIQNAKPPTSVKLLRKFLGMCNYYRKFVKDYAKICEPLTKLLKKDTKFKWTEQCDKAFNDMKFRMTSTPILQFPDFNKEFILCTDSSDYSIGYVLTQKHGDKEHPVSYGGRALRDSELKWHITDKEGLALVEGIQHFKHYLVNKKFTVITDNAAVKYLQKNKDCNGRLGRWSLFLQGYNFEIKHRSGSANNTADFLSRQVYEEPKTDSKEQSYELNENVYSANVEEPELVQVTFMYPDEVDSCINATQVQTKPDPALNFIDLAASQQQCEDFRDIYNYVNSRQVPNDPSFARTIVAESYNYTIEDGILHHFYSKRNKKIPAEERLVKQIAIPRQLRDDLLKSYHDCIAGGGHQGFERTYEAVRSKYYWPTMYNDICQYVKTCEICQQSKRAFNSRPPPLKPIPVDDVFSRWHMDILSGLPTTKDKYKHVLLLVDSYSKYCEAFPLRTQEATEVASVLFREIICRYGAPRVLVSDRGRNFMSNLIKALAELFEIKRTYTSAYHPMTNGLVESKNSYILQALRAYCNGDQCDWPDLLPGILMAYRSTPASQSTEYSPFFMLYGREMRLPVDTVLQPKDHLPQDYKIHLGRMLQNLETCRKLAKENIERAQQKYKHQYDKRAKPTTFRTAQRVWLYCTKVPTGRAPKLHRKWVGPYYITMMGPNNTFKLRNAITNFEVKSLVHAMRLKPYYDPNNRPTNVPEELEGDEEQLDPEEFNFHDRRDQPEDIDNNPENGDVNTGEQPDEPDVPTSSTDQSQKTSQRPSQTKQSFHGTCSKGKCSRKNPCKLCRRKMSKANKTLPADTTKISVNPKPVPENQVKTNNDQKQKRIPFCHDCETNNCKPFTKSDIVKIIQSKRNNGVLYYHIKLANNTTGWYFKCKIPDQLQREFHVNRTLSGRKRRKPLSNKQHKFFKTKTNEMETQTNQPSETSTPALDLIETKTVNAINSAGNQTSNQTNNSSDISNSFIGIQVLSDKVHLKFKGTNGSFYYKNLTHDYLHGNIIYSKLKAEIHRRETRILNYNPCDFCMKVHTDIIYEITVSGNELICLQGMMDKNAPPFWCELRRASSSALYRLLDTMDYQINLNTSDLEEMQGGLS